MPGTPHGAGDELETFVIVHDEDLLLELEQAGTFRHLPRNRYLFVGNGTTGRLRGRDDVVVARTLPDNIEHHPHLLSFTGWYAVARNRLATAASVALLEYDVRIEADFAPRTLAELQRGRCIVGFVPFALSHPMYLHATPWLIRSLREVYGVDAASLISDHLAGGGADVWSSTTNMAMDVEDLDGFVDWFVPLTEVFRHDPIGAHVHERAVPVYCLLNDIEIACVPGLLHHDRLISHGILAVPQDEARRLADERARSTDPRDDG